MDENILVSVKDNKHYTEFLRQIREDQRYHSTKVDLAIDLVKEILRLPSDKRGKIAIFSRSVRLNDILKIALECELDDDDLEIGSLDGRLNDRGKAGRELEP